MFVSLGVRGVYLHALHPLWALFHWVFAEGRFVCLGKGIYLSPGQVEELKKHVDVMERWIGTGSIDNISMSDGVFLTGTTFNGKNFLHIRKYEGDKPTATGIALFRNELKQFIDFSLY